MKTIFKVILLCVTLFAQAGTKKSSSSSPEVAPLPNKQIQRISCGVAGSIGGLQDLMKECDPKFQFSISSTAFIQPLRTDPRFDHFYCCTVSEEPGKKTPAE